MAFAGTPVTKLISTRKVRVRGVSLAAGATGEIVLGSYPSPPAGAVVLPDGFQPKEYDDVTDVDSIEITVHPNSPGAAPLHYSIQKTGGPFVALVVNADGANATGNLEIYVEFH